MLQNSKKNDLIYEHIYDSPSLSDLNISNLGML